MASRVEGLLILAGMFVVGLIAVLNNLPPSTPRRLFAVDSLQRILDQIRGSPPADGPGADFSAPGCEDYYNFSMIDDDVVLRLDALGDDSRNTLLAFECAAEQLGLVAEWPDEDEYGLEKSIIVGLGTDTSKAAESGARIMEKVSGIRSGSPVTLATTGFKAN
jgi:hypothetical protein